MSVLSGSVLCGKVSVPPAIVRPCRSVRQACHDSHILAITMVASSVRSEKRGRHFFRLKFMCDGSSIRARAGDRREDLAGRTAR